MANKPTLDEMRLALTKRPKRMAEKVDLTRLYRGGYNPEPYEAQDIGAYGGLFASGTPEPASSHGPHLHYTDIPTNKILTHYALNYEVPHEKVKQALIKFAPHVKEDKELFDKLHDVVVGDKGQDLRNLDDDEIYDLLRKEQGADADNEAQRLRGQIAKHLGYHAVELEDEHGLSYLTTHGVKFKPYVTKSKGGEVLPHHQREANKAKFLEPTKVKERLYHGTNKDINSFKVPKNALGVWATKDPDVAKEYATISARGVSDPPSIYPMHASLKNPANKEQFGDAWELASKDSSRLGWNTHDERHRKILQDQGFDGAILDDSVVVFDPRKIKSAIGNRGTYDTTNPDITKSKGGKVNEMMSQFMPPPDNEPFDPIETAKRNLQGAWDIVKQVPSNVANLASNPIEYTKNLPKPSIEQMAMMLQPSTLVGKIGMPKPKTTMLPKSEYDANLANYMAESKAPKLYHGTNKDITEFDKNKLKRIGWGEGFHMAEDPSMASQYAGTGSGANVMPVHASIKNPLVLNSPHDWWDIIPGETNQTKTAWAKSQGYDGIKYPHSQPNQNETGMAWVAFEPTQIKSAIGNRGTFDSNFADINKAKGGSVPSEPGSTPIKEGHVRLYHQTDGDNLREIEKHGLLLKHAKGIEGPRAIYAGETPFYGDATKKPTLEFQVPKEHWDAPFVLRDVHPQDFISAHYPWHRHARYLEDESGIKNVLSGKFDTLKGDEGKAVEYIKNKYSTKKAKGGKVTHAHHLEIEERPL